MAKEKGVSTLIGIIIIVAAAVVAFGGVFAYQYFSKSQTPMPNAQPNPNAQNSNSETNQPAITVISPKGGEIWKIGQTYNITWTYSGMLADTNVCIRLADYNSGRSVGTDIKCMLVSNKNFKWTVPVSINESAGDVNSVGNRWEIEIVYGGPGTEYGYGFGKSANYFTITK